MSLTQQELAYLDRFCYEVNNLILGEGSISEYVEGYYSDLGALTNYAPKEVYQRWMLVDRPEPSVVPFPWKSLEDIKVRRAELEKECFDHAQGETERLDEERQSR